MLLSLRAPPTRTSAPAAPHALAHRLRFRRCDSTSRVGHTPAVLWPGSAGARLTSADARTHMHCDVTRKPTVSGNLLTASPPAGATWRATSRQRPRVSPPHPCGAHANDLRAEPRTVRRRHPHARRGTGQLRTHRHIGRERSVATGNPHTTGNTARGLRQTWRGVGRGLSSGKGMPGTYVVNVSDSSKQGRRK